MEAHLYDSRAAEPSPGLVLQIGAFVLPALQCAVCPLCLGVFGGALAGARLGFLEDERLHLGLILVALVADVFILRAAVRHHQNRGPLALCVAGALSALAGHLVAEALEYAGFAALMVAALWNVVLLRRHRPRGGACCAHQSAHVAKGAAANAHGP